jgi:hypothetical protein
MKTFNYKQELKKELENKFHSPEKFSQEIENLIIKNPEYNYITAIIEYCESNDIDVELVPKLITKPLKEKLNQKLSNNWRLTKIVMFAKRLLKTTEPRQKLSNNWQRIKVIRLGKKLY